MKLTNLSDNLYSLRKSRGLSQEEFAEKIHISRQAVSKWERGEAYPDTENLIMIASFYGVTLDELVNSSDISERNTADCEVSDEESKNNILDDEDDKDDKDDSQGGVTVEGSLHFNWRDLPYPIIVVVIYLLLGFLTPNGFGIWWTLFVTVPIYYSIVECIKKRMLSPFAYPVFATFVFLLIGMLSGIWHPTWVIFVTIPIYYPIAASIDRRYKK